jgi:hypothetical protein
MKTMLDVVMNSQRSGWTERASPGSSSTSKTPFFGADALRSVKIAFGSDS